MHSAQLGDDENGVRDIKIAKSAFQVATKAMQQQHNDKAGDDDAFNQLEPDQP